MDYRYENYTQLWWDSKKWLQSCLKHKSMDLVSGHTDSKTFPNFRSSDLEPISSFWRILNQFLTIMYCDFRFIQQTHTRQLSQLLYDLFIPNFQTYNCCCQCYYYYNYFTSQLFSVPVLMACEFPIWCPVQFLSCHNISLSLDTALLLITATHKVSRTLQNNMDTEQQMGRNRERLK